MPPKRSLRFTRYFFNTIFREYTMMCSFAEVALALPDTVCLIVEVVDDDRATAVARYRRREAARFQH